jgi:hypothetical protein
MGTSEVDLTGSWAPQACTLPTSEQPLRVAEFDQFFTDAVRSVDRAAPTRLVLDLEPTAEVASQAAGLAARETGCCSFFTFTLTASGGALGLEVSVPAGYVNVLDALAHRAVTLAGARA